MLGLARVLDLMTCLQILNVALLRLIRKEINLNIVDRNNKMINPTIWNKKFILAFALISILLILFIFPFIQARVLIDELQTDLSFRSGLEVETEYYGACGVAPLQENFYYYE